MLVSWRTPSGNSQNNWNLERAFFFFHFFLTDKMNIYHERSVNTRADIKSFDAGFYVASSNTYTSQCCPSIFCHTKNNKHVFSLCLCPSFFVFCAIIATEKSFLPYIPMWFSIIYVYAILPKLYNCSTEILCVYMSTMPFQMIKKRIFVYYIWTIVLR